MTKPKKNKEAAGEAEDWATIPFDEAEDDARWTKLIEETDKLIEETVETENLYGELLTEYKISDIQISERQTEDELF